MNEEDKIKKLEQEIATIKRDYKKKYFSLPTAIIIWSIIIIYSTFLFLNLNIKITEGTILAYLYIFLKILITIIIPISIPILLIAILIKIKHNKK